MVDPSDLHVYQPGLLLVPFGAYRPGEVVRPRVRYLSFGVDLVTGEVDRVDADHNCVVLVDGRRLPYDFLVIASGTQPRPGQTQGMLGPLWRRRVFDFYTLDGATALAEALRTFTSGRFIVHVVDTPIKCPVAPLEFAFLAEAHLRRRGLRDCVQLTYATPLPGAYPARPSTCGRTRWCTETCFRTSRNAAGLDEHQVRRWHSWYRHTILAMLADHPVHLPTAKLRSGLAPRRRSRAVWVSAAAGHAYRPGVAAIRARHRRVCCGSAAASARRTISASRSVT